MPPTYRYSTGIGPQLSESRGVDKLPQRRFDSGVVKFVRSLRAILEGDTNENFGNRDIGRISWDGVSDQRSFGEQNEWHRQLCRKSLFV
jgi:hypothetical protein